MEIIAHRGFWLTQDEKNTEKAFLRALSNGFGIETDFRDYKGELVISHDIPSGNEMSADDFFKLYSTQNMKTFIALNIKADGLQGKLKELINKYNVQNYFCFDMSIPDTLGYIQSNLKIATRHSEYEQEFPFYTSSDFVWLDCFKSDWFGEKEINQHLNNNKQVCIVSSELHKRDFTDSWWKYKQIDGKLMICTDHPQQAREYFNG